jgi:predicted transcriptional regulator
MFGFLHSHKSSGPQPLGPLETEVLSIVWDHGEVNVHDVVRRLSRQLAYTTIMTTLDRLYKKGVLNRQKNEHAFFYTPRFTRHEWVRSL